MMQAAPPMPAVSVPRIQAMPAPQPLSAQDDFEAIYEAEEQARREREQKEQARARADALGTTLMAEFSEAEKARALFEQRWLDDLMQYRGQYGDNVQTRLKESSGSRVFYRMTTVKVNTTVSRLMDLLFPARSKNWSLAATPDPLLPREIVMEAIAPELEAKTAEAMQGIMGELQAQNVIPDQLAVQKLQAQAQQEAMQSIDLDRVKRAIATERAEKMQTVIDDQLKESPAGAANRPSWQQNCKQVIHSACLYGMGVLKGPLVEEREIKRVQPDENGQMREQATEKRLAPHHEAVSLWNVYPDPGALKPSELRFVWQMHLKTDKELWDLSAFPGFDGAAIAAHIKDNADGDASMTTWETMLLTLNEDNVGRDLKKRFRVYERWGYLTGQELRDAGNAVSDEDLPKVFPANVWVLGNRVIKAMVNPMEGVDIPYFFYPYQIDETAFWPEGIATAIRFPQTAINAAVRATQDNAVLSSGPIIGVNMQALADGEDPTSIQARRVLLFSRSGMNLNQAFQAVTVPSCISENLTLIKFWQEAADEMSTPRFNAGDGRVSGAGETASGLSMLMGASNILLKDHVKDFDDHVTGPFIRSMYRWNMLFNPREDIKGDYEVSATGSQSLIAKEVRAQQIPGVMNMLQNPGFARYIKDDELLKVALEQTDLPADRLLRTDEEADEFQQQQMLMQATAQAEAMSQALVAELQKQGATPEQIQQQLMLLLAQQQAQAIPQGGMQ